METLDDVQTAIAAINDQVTTLLATVATEHDEVLATLKALTDQVVAGTPASPEKLSAIMGSLTAIRDRISTATSDIAALVPTPPVV